MGKASRDKGGRGERELLHRINESGRLVARKVPLSGGTTFQKGDLLVGWPCDMCEGTTLDLDAPREPHAPAPIPCPVCKGTGQMGGVRQWEVKRRAQGFKVIDGWLEDNWAVAYRRDRGEWTVTLRLDDFLGMLK